MVAQVTVNHLVGGSNPSQGAIMEINMKRYMMILIYVNGVFLITNTFFLLIHAWPVVNMVGALMSLFGLACAWQVYNECDE